MRQDGGIIKPTIICFIGLNRSGKSTASNFYANYLFNAGFKIQELSLATPIKKLAAKYLDLDDHRSNRELLETFSADLKENLGEDVFIRKLLNDIDEDADFVLIDDLRYFVEINTLCQIYDTKIIHINREVISNIEDARRLKLLLFQLITNDIKIDWTINEEIDTDIGQQLCEHRFDKYPSITMSCRNKQDHPKKMGQFKFIDADKNYVYTIDCSQGIHTVQMLDGSNQVLVVTSDFLVPIDTLQERIENELLPTLQKHGKQNETY